MLIKPLHAGNGLIVDEAEAIKTADKLGLFVVGVNPADAKWKEA